MKVEIDRADENSVVQSTFINQSQAQINSTNQYQQPAQTTSNFPNVSEQQNAHGNVDSNGGWMTSHRPVEQSIEQPIHAEKANKKRCIDGSAPAAASHSSGSGYSTPSSHSPPGQSLAASQEKVPIPPTPGYSAPSGPMTAGVSLPARKKPGRKAMQPTGGSEIEKRREQNRASQRNFRDRRKTENEELKAELHAHKVQYQQEIAKLTRQLEERASKCQKLGDDLSEAQSQCAQMSRTISALQNENQSLKWAHRQLDGTASQSGSGFPKRDSGTSLSSHPEISRSEQQQQQQQQQQPQSQQNQTTTLAEPDYTGMETDFTSTHAGAQVVGGCGFCNSPDNCLCRMREEDKAAAATAPTAPTAPMPGSCDACRQDPERARACRRVATMAEQSNSIASGDNSISCTDFMNRASQSGFPLPSIDQLFPDQIHARQTSNGGYEVQEHEAAEVLRTLGNQDVQNSQANTRSHQIMKAAGHTW